MNFSSISGVLISLAALVWVALIVPVLFKSRDSSAENQRTRQAARQALGSSTVRLLRLIRARNSLLFFGASSALATVLGFTANIVWLVISGLLVTSVLSVALRRNFVLRREIFSQSFTSKRQTIKPKNLAKFANESATTLVNKKHWTPDQLPPPMHHLNKNGTLEQSVLAEVHDLSAQISEPIKVESIEEILRRRRAI